MRILHITAAVQMNNFQDIPMQIMSNGYAIFFQRNTIFLYSNLTVASHAVSSNTSCDYSPVT